MERGSVRVLLVSLVMVSLVFSIVIPSVHGQTYTLTEGRYLHHYDIQWMWANAPPFFETDIQAVREANDILDVSSLVVFVSDTEAIEVGVWKGSMMVGDTSVVSGFIAKWEVTSTDGGFTARLEGAIVLSHAPSFVGIMIQHGDVTIYWDGNQVSMGHIPEQRAYPVAHISLERVSLA